jgi:hypothetical protein
VVVQDLEDLLGPSAQAVVQGREEVKQEQRDTIDRQGQDAYRFTLHRGDGHHHGHADQRQDGADQVADTVEPLAVVHSDLRDPVSGHLSVRLDAKKTLSPCCFPLSAFRFLLPAVT